jgi:ubiquitin-protein ligase
MRLLRDIKNVMTDSLTENGIYYIHDEVDMMKGYALIVGPPNTPYFGGYYFFEITYPFNYPHSPPNVKYCTNNNDIRFHPNLYRCGKVCISLLNTWKGAQWTSCQTISTVLLTLCMLFCTDPLLNEPGIRKSDNDINPYNEIIEYANFDIAVCDIIFKHSNLFMPFFELFSTIIKDTFQKNYNTLLEIAENKYNMYKNPAYIRTVIYSLTVRVDYEMVINKLIEAKKVIN